MLGDTALHLASRSLPMSSQFPCRTPPARTDSRSHARLADWQDPPAIRPGRADYAEETPAWAAGRLATVAPLRREADRTGRDTAHGPRVLHRGVRALPE